MLGDIRRHARCRRSYQPSATLLGMIGDQALQHFGKPFGWALAADALYADARAFAEEEDLVREKLGFRELGLAAERDEPLSETALEFLDHPSRRMVLIRELCGSV